MLLDLTLLKYFEHIRNNPTKLYSSILRTSTLCGQMRQDPALTTFQRLLIHSTYTKLPPIFSSIQTFEFLISGYLLFSRNSSTFLSKGLSSPFFLRASMESCLSEQMPISFVIETSSLSLCCIVVLRRILSTVTF